MESINSALPVQLTRSASPRAHEGAHIVGVTPAYQGTAMPFAGRGRTTTDLLITDLRTTVDGPHACAPPD